jgi:membrane protein DedA with SNARE-associated domain
METVQDLAASIATFIDSLTGLITDSPLTYVVIFGLAAVDVVLPILPSEAAVLVEAVLAGTGQLSIGWVMLAAGTGAFVGDNVAYWIGRRAGRPLIERILRSNDRLIWAEDQFRERGGSLVIVGRFIPGGRTAVAIGAGVLRFRWSRFVGFDLIAAAIWSLQAALPGYLGGSAFPDRPWIGLVVGIGIAILVAGAIEVVRRVTRR